MDHFHQGVEDLGFLADFVAEAVVLIAFDQREGLDVAILDVAHSSTPGITIGSRCPITPGVRNPGCTSGASSRAQSVISHRLLPAWPIVLRGASDRQSRSSDPFRSGNRGARKDRLDRFGQWRK